jgi:TatD DNase family protein
VSFLTSIVDALQYVDTHCHVDLFPDPGAVMQEAQEARVGIVAVTNTPSVFEPMVRLAEPFPSVFVAVGLHPELAIERESELGLVPALWARTRFVGEVGLDGTARDPRALASQQRVLASFLRCAADHPSRLMTVHSRRAAREVLSTLDHVTATVVLHWFSGSLSQAREAAARGWFFSVNSAMLGSDRGRALIASLPQAQVLTETDGPFVEVAGRPSRPVDVRGVVDGLARLWRVEHEEARHRIMDNFFRCVSATEG